MPNADAGAEQGWWYDTAMERVDAAIEELEIPWDEIELGETEAVAVEAPALSERLAKVSSYMVRVGRKLSRVDSQLRLTKQAMDHAVQKMIAENDTGGGTVASKTAAFISSHPRLRQAKIDVMEGEALKRSLDGVEDALETIWKTTSRILSERLREPVE